MLNQISTDFKHPSKASTLRYSTPLFTQLAFRNQPHFQLVNCQYYTSATSRVAALNSMLCELLILSFVFGRLSSAFFVSMRPLDRFVSLLHSLSFFGHSHHCKSVVISFFLFWMLLFSLLSCVEIFSHKSTIKGNANHVEQKKSNFIFKLYNPKYEMIICFFWVFYNSIFIFGFIKKLFSTSLCEVAFVRRIRKPATQGGSAHLCCCAFGPSLESFPSFLVLPLPFRSLCCGCRRTCRIRIRMLVVIPGTRGFRGYVVLHRMYRTRYIISMRCKASIS